MREIKYNQAISEAHMQSMERDPSVFLMGVGIGDPTGLFGTTLEARKKFGEKRVFDTPMSENTITGVGVGAAICGMRPVLIHARNDFLLLTMDQIVNHAAKWKYMAGGKLSVPFLIRAIIGRGWGQAAQHSQSLQAMFAHVPGLQVIMPVSPYDAKGLILASMESDKTTICIEHRWLYEKTGPVPEEYYTVPIGKGSIIRKGKDVTLIAISHMVLEAKTAAEELAKENIDVEILDPRSLRPLDEELILESLKKTGRLVIADTGWKVGGISAEIAALCVEKGFSSLKAPILRVALPDTPTPCSPALESLYYPAAPDLVRAVKSLYQVQTEKKKEAIVTISPTDKKEFTGSFLASVPSITVIVPAFNEEGNLAGTLANVIPLIERNFSDYEIFVFNDASADRTGKIADEWAAKNKKIKVIHNPANRGLGYNYKKGVEMATKDYVIMVPGDNEISLESLERTMKMAGQADIIVPYTNNMEVRPRMRVIFSKIYTFVMNALFGLRLHYFNGTVVHRREIIQSIKIETDGFGYQAEALIKLIKSGKTYKELPIYIEYRTAGRSAALNYRNLWRVFKSIVQLFGQIHFRK